MLALAAESAESHWPGRVGKILLLVAGLVALLDLAGPTKLSRWARSANRRRAVARRNSRLLHRARPFSKLAKRMAEEAAARIWRRHVQKVYQESTGIRRFGIAATLSSYGKAWQTSDPRSTRMGFEHLTAAEFEAFTRREHDALGLRPDARSVLENQVSIAVRLERGAIDLLIDNLPPDESRALTWFREDFYGKAARTHHGTMVSLSATMLAAILLASVVREPGLSPGVVFFATLVFGGTVALTISAGLSNPTVMVTLKWVAAVGWFRLAWVARVLIGRERSGRPLRGLALALFVVGSLLDLATSWNP